MKIFQIMALSLFISGCAVARSSTAPVKLDVVGKSLPAIKHINDMKMKGDTLLFVYESEDGDGQRLLRRAVVDIKSHTLRVSPDMGKREDGYFISYMPYPFITDNGSMRIISQDDCEIFTLENDTAFVRTKQFLMSNDSKVPFRISQFVQDIFMTGPDKYVFIGREPNGGSQYAMSADLTSSRIDTIRQINISPELQTWIPNTGEMASSAKHNHLVFAYRLHPVIEIFDTDGNIINSVKIGDDTFNPKTLDEADFDDLNNLHTVDLTYTPDYIYALYWGFKYADSRQSNPTIIKLDWNGNIIARYSDLAGPLYRIAAKDDSTVIGWNGNEFILLSL